MQRFIVGILALAALVQVIHCGPVTSNINALSQKLEDHYHGKNLDNEITFEECESTFVEFASIKREYDLLLPEQPEPLFKGLLFLEDFMYRHLKNFSAKLMKLETDDEAAKEFIKDLEKAYKRFRPIYNFEFSLEQVPLEQKREIEFAISHLKGEGELPNGNQFQDATDAAGKIQTALNEICEKRDIYENQDEYEALLRIWSTPEIGSLTNWVWPLFYDETDQKKYFEGDEATVKKFQQVYQDGVQAVISNLRSD